MAKKLAKKKKKKTSKKPARKVVKKSKDKYTCTICGLLITVDNVCGCVEACDIICCDEAMKKKK